MKTFDIPNSDYFVRLVENGDAYGNGAVHGQDDPLVAFYRRAPRAPEGWCVSRYYRSTLLSKHPVRGASWEDGMLLQGGWEPLSINGAELRAVRHWLDPELAELEALRVAAGAEVAYWKALSALEDALLGPEDACENFGKKSLTLTERVSDLASNGDASALQVEHLRKLKERLKNA